MNDILQVSSNSVNNYTILSFICYLLLIVGIGIWSARFSSAGLSEYFIGGRKISKYVVALSAVVSGRSAWLLLGVTGMAYKVGTSAVWTVIGYIIVEMFLFLFYAKRLRRFSEEYDCITLPDFFAIRFGDKSGSLRVILVIIISIFMIAYVSAQFIGGGKAFAIGFGLTEGSGIFITAIIVLFYTLIGGFLAVSLTDTLQAILMLFALVVLPVIAIFHQGGLSEILMQLNILDPKLIDPTAISIGVAIGFLGIGLGSPGNPHIIARYMSIRDPDELNYSAVIGTIWNVLMAWGALFIGLVGRLYYPQASSLPDADTEKLFPLLAARELHPLLFGVIIASIFAAIMSTADSQLLVAASSIVRDLYEKVLKKDKSINSRKLVLFSRVLVFILVLLALFLGIVVKEQLFWLVLIAWAGLGAALGPTSILALYWKKTTKSGVIAGILSGTIITIIWYYTPWLKELIYELVPAFIMGILATVVVSSFSTRPLDTDKMFDIMKGKKKVNI